MDHFILAFSQMWVVFHVKITTVMWYGTKSMGMNPRYVSMLVIAWF